jgi:hypothetical protein
MQTRVKRIVIDIDPYSGLLSPSRRGIGAELKAKGERFSQEEILLLPRSFSNGIRPVIQLCIQIGGRQ